MENKKPLILVSNDDGVMAKGINELVRFLRPLGDIVVMAPDSPRSGSGCALTVTQPVHYQLVKKEVGLTVYKCTGTPTDCIKLARNTENRILWSEALIMEIIRQLICIIPVLWEWWLKVV